MGSKCRRHRSSKGDRSTEKWQGNHDFTQRGRDQFKTFDEDGQQVTDPHHRGDTTEQCDSTPGRRDRPALLYRSGEDLTDGKSGQGHHHCQRILPSCLASKISSIMVEVPTSASSRLEVKGIPPRIADPDDRSSPPLSAPLRFASAVADLRLHFRAGVYGTTLPLLTGDPPGEPSHRSGGTVAVPSLPLVADPTASSVRLQRPLPVGKPLPLRG